MKQAIGCALRWSCAGPLLCCASVAADAELHPYAAEQYQYDSNVFNLSSRQQAILLNGDPARDDRQLRSVAGAEAILGWDRSRLSTDVEGRRLLYDRFSQLDHNEYLMSGRFDWKLLSSWDGAFEARQERRMASFANRVSTQLAQERDRNLSGHVNVNLDPDWRLESALVSHRLASPLPGFPLFRLDENTGTLGLKYQGLGKVTTGVEASYTDGRFHGVPRAPAYTQYTAVLTLSYALSGVSSVDANAGYTRLKGRDDTGESVSGFSGELGYTRHLSGKTTVHARAFRRVNGYIAGADAIIDSGAEAGADWQATSKISLSVDYDWTYSTYRALATAAAVSSTRSDHYQATTLNLNYAALDWLGVRAYGAYYNRSSDIDINAYNEALAGVEMKVRLP